jgi:hypothetical protein
MVDGDVSIGVHDQRVQLVLWVWLVGVAFAPDAGGDTFI